MNIEYRIERLDFSNPDDMKKLVDLQNAVYVGKHVFSSQTFQHWYLDNPNGRVVSYNALYGDIIAAHYAVIPVKMEISERIVPGLLSMATVTHPEHQGKGLFKQLAKCTYDYATRMGYEFVIGVANSNSFPGFIKHLRFQDVGMLDVMVGFSKKIREDSSKTFRFYWDEKTVRWRLEREKYSKGLTSVFGTKAIWKFKKAPFIHTYMGCISEGILAGLNIPQVCSLLRPINLYIVMGSNAKKMGYHELPKFIKHSPFHLIFLDLTEGKLPKMTKDNIFFQLMDFDVA